MTARYAVLSAWYPGNAPEFEGRVAGDTLAELTAMLRLLWPYYTEPVRVQELKRGAGFNLWFAHANGQAKVRLNRIPERS